MKLINTTGFLSTGEPYKLKSEIRYIQSMKENFFFLHCWKYDEDFQAWGFMGGVSVYYTKKNFKEKMIELFTKAEKQFGLRLLKPELEVIKN